MTTEEIEQQTFKRIQLVRAAEWLSLGALSIHLELGKDDIARLVKRPDFPWPVSPTGTMRCRRWRKQKVDEWVNSDQEERDRDLKKRLALRAAAQKVARRQSLRRFHKSKRRASKLQRMPKWADSKAIRAIYDEAKRITLRTGIEHHVDHDIPLNGRLVSGLHVSDNLQILPWFQNIKKHNKYDVN